MNQARSIVLSLCLCVLSSLGGEKKRVWREEDGMQKEGSDEWKSGGCTNEGGREGGTDQEEGVCEWKMIKDGIKN